MIVLAILLPGLSFLLRGKILPAILAFVFQVVACFTLIYLGLGFFIWLGLATWAIISYVNSQADKNNSGAFNGYQQQAE